MTHKNLNFFCWLLLNKFETYFWAGWALVYLTLFMNGPYFYDGF